ncbi:hypothetical protein A0H81_02869 [Grifola frondosa]|uniref:Uncharacterized protein n=1 Tax=Grifola frondosa TaxID=5627 RepID=A0A1C7MKI1_GRIFR|nr:hypothetical protein A0H81_02869 [Grifola frondosa]
MSQQASGSNAPAVASPPGPSSPAQPAAAAVSSTALAPTLASSTASALALASDEIAIEGLLGRLTTRVAEMEKAQREIDEALNLPVLGRK